MKKTVIILLPVHDYDRIEDAEKLEDKNFYSLEEIQEEFEGKKNEDGEDAEEPLIYTSLSNFIVDCNDQYIGLENYWITYVNTLS